ncbi:MAG: phosphoenolpyruvate-protein phosphotransferase [Anaerocolumna sp.]|jgi:phosphotransferase system enzyme I (PtsI)|nr:phosphoenolpyruvate-protein phosphotransferase [Anaerocolumna sp.]
MKTLKVNKTASAGIVMGRVLLYEKVKVIVNHNNISEDEIPMQIERYEKAVKCAETDLNELAKTNDIFWAHLEMVKDPTLYEAVEGKIKTELKNAEGAVEDATNELILIFESIEDEYMRERASDIKDIKERLLKNLIGNGKEALSDISDKVILIAQDLTPSDTAELDFNHILGFITRDGGVTSHVSIMAKGLSIPALVGVKDILTTVNKEDYIIMDAGSGDIFINPEHELIEEYKSKQIEQEKTLKELLEQNSLPAITKDKRSVKLCANVGNIKDIEKALDYNIDGIGLFRSEFLYMESDHFPTEEEQFMVYKEAVLLVPQELTIRTLDIGGDKELSYFEFEKEENPFLGYRAIRISLDLKDLFKTQLRAILRASAFGNIRIMFPMIISVEELRMAKEILDECKAELKMEGMTYDPSIKAGIMIETPASVLCVEDLGAEADFFSIGTNDLTQYLLACDRGNKKISALYNSFHPAVLRSIKRIIDAGHENNIKVGMCGEFASDEQAVLLLLGLGLDEFSMTASSIPNVKNLIRNASYQEEEALSKDVLKAKTIKEIYRLIQKV